MWGQRVAVCGSTPELGEWDTDRSILLSDEEYPTWRGTLAVGSEPILFSYLLVQSDGTAGSHRFIRWEQGDSRELKPMAATCLLVHHRLDDPLFGAVEPIADDLVIPNLAIAEPLGAVTRPKPVLLGNFIPAATKGKKTVTFSPTLIASLVAEEATPETRRRRKRCVTFSRCVESPSGDDFHCKYKESKKVLGSGGMCANVYLATRRSDSVEVAVKILDTSGLSNYHERRAMNEVRNQLSMNHRHVCGLLEVFEEPGRLRLVMERLRGPDLYDSWSRRDSGCFSEGEAVNYMRQISSAVAYCHSVGVCHRDLKLENVCLEDDSPDACVKLIDFGLSVDITLVPSLEGVVGTLYYMAPEVWKGKYNEKCDTWSMGVLAYILLDGGPPFEDDDDNVVKRLICKGVYTFQDNPWKLLSLEARRFVAALLRVDATKRLDAQQALEHAWLAPRYKAEPADAQATTLARGVATQEVDLGNRPSSKRAVCEPGAPPGYFCSDEIEVADGRPSALHCKPGESGRRLPPKYASNRVLSLGVMA